MARGNKSMAVAIGAGALAPAFCSPATWPTRIMVSRKDTGFDDRIAHLMNLCVVSYVSKARTTNWNRLTAFEVTCEQHLRSINKKKQRAICKLLKSRKTLGEYANIV